MYVCVCVCVRMYRSSETQRERVVVAVVALVVVGRAPRRRKISCAFFTEDDRTKEREGREREKKN